MQYIILRFVHDIQDVIPYCDFIQGIKSLLLGNNIGEYLGDDMAIDGGDVEAVFSSPDARALFNLLEPHFRRLSFMRNVQITLVFGQLDSDAESCELTLE